MDLKPPGTGGGDTWTVRVNGANAASARAGSGRGGGSRGRGCTRPDMPASSIGDDWRRVGDVRNNHSDVHDDKNGGDGSVAAAAMDQGGSVGPCPVCDRLFSTADLEGHVNLCLDVMAVRDEEAAKLAERKKRWELHRCCQQSGGLCAAQGGNGWRGTLMIGIPKGRVKSNAKVSIEAAGSGFLLRGFYAQVFVCIKRQ